MDDERMLILQKIEAGIISVEDGAYLMNAIEGWQPRTQAETQYTFPDMEAHDTGEIAHDVQDIHSRGALSASRFAKVNAGGEDKYSGEDHFNEDFSKWKIWSQLIFAVFVVLTTLSSVWIIQGWLARPWGWGFWLAWIPFGVGVLGMISLYDAHWIHIRIQQPKGSRPQRIAISLPLPLRLSLFLYPLVSRWVPAQVKGQDVLVILRDLETSLTSKDPVHIQVDENNGEKVEIYIG